MAAREAGEAAVGMLRISNIKFPQGAYGGLDAPRTFQYFVPRTLQILAALGPNDWPSDSEEETSQRSAFRSYSDANSKNLAVSWPLYVIESIFATCSA